MAFLFKRKMAHIVSEENKFKVPLKGIIDINGRFTEPFKLVIPLEQRNHSFDEDYTRYSDYIALHVEGESRVWVSMKRNGGHEVNLSDVTEILQHETDIGLEPEVVTTYWLSYDRDHQDGKTKTIKYGKGYAMVETTILVCRSEDLFGIQDIVGRTDVPLLLYRTQTDINNGREMTVGAGIFIKQLSKSFCVFA